MGLHILHLCLYLLISKLSKLGITEKVIAYMRILSIFNYVDAMNKPACVSFEVQMGNNHKTKDASS